MDGLSRELRIDRAAQGLLPDQFRTFRRLARELEAHAGRWGLFLLQYEHDADRHAVGAAIDALCERPARVEVSPGRFSQWADLEAELVRVANAADAIQIFGLDEWLDDRSDRERTESLIRAWNVRRDGFARDVPVPVLCWLRAATLKQLARFAPDLWSWRAGVHSFAMKRSSEDLAERQLPAFAARTGPIDNRTIGQRTQRLRDISQYLDENLPSDDVAWALRGELLDELASLHASLGQLDEALRIRKEEELPVYERLGDARSKAITQGKIAGILQARGQLDEALRILKDEALPACERLGDVRSKAVTQGRIADILQARGQLDQALRILKNEALPTFERLGDVRSKAVTQGKIADILQARGQLDEALHIRKEDQLPVYERLGDVRSKAVTQGKIADILQARGQLDEALALHAQRLPVAERMGDLESIAQIKYATASIRFQRDDHQTGGLQAIHDDLAKAFAISRQLERPDFIGAIGALLAQVLAMGGFPQEALSVLDAAEAGYETLGDAAGLAQVRALREQIAPKE